MPINLIDPDAVDRYLEGFLPGDETGAKLLKLALGKILRKREANAQEIHDLPDDAPPWLREKWPRGSPYHRFVPDNMLSDKVRHIADWITVSVREDEAWLRETNENGEPRKLLKLGNLEQAYKEADKAMRARNQGIAAQIVRDDEGEETVMELDAGYRIVQLTSKHALDVEGVDKGLHIAQGSAGIP